MLNIYVCVLYTFVYTGYVLNASFLGGQCTSAHGNSVTIINLSLLNFTVEFKTIVTSPLAR